MGIQHINLAAYANRFSEYTELRLQRNVNRRIMLLNGDVVTNTRSVDGGVSARVHKDGVWGFASRPQIEGEAITDIIAEGTRNAEFLARHARAHGAADNARLPRGRGSYDSDFATRKPRLGQRELIEFLRALDAHIAATYPDLKSRAVILQDLDMEKHSYNADDSRGYSNTTRSLIAIRLTALNDQGEPVDLMRPFGGRGQFEDVFQRPDDLFPEIARLHGHLMAKRSAVAPRAGVHDVILDSELAGILAHEAIGHTTEADLVRSGSVAGDMLGQQVASPLITMVDFAHTYQGQTLPVPVYLDDEGMPSEDTVLIERGVLKGFMHNKESAAFFGTAATGNARAYQFFDEPLIRMRNTAILPGDSKLEDMIASVEDGYYLIRPANGQADSTSEFMFGVSLGYEIKDGKLGRAITDTTISGVAFDMLKTVTMVSDQMHWSCAGMCGKKQIIPVGMGGPAIKCRVHLGGA
jgi:TldD protein